MSNYFEEFGDCFVLQLKIEMQNGEEWKEGDDVVVDMFYEVLLEIFEVDLKFIELEKLVVKLEDVDVEEVFGKLVEIVQNFKFCCKGFKVKDGDQVVMDFVGKIDGEVFDGGVGEDFLLVLGFGQFISGFEEQLVGVKVEEEKDVIVFFLEEY